MLVVGGVRALLKAIILNILRHKIYLVISLVHVLNLGDYQTREMFVTLYCRMIFNEIILPTIVNVLSLYFDSLLCQRGSGPNFDIRLLAVK